MNGSEQIRLLIVEDHALVRSLLRTLVLRWRPAISIRQAASVAEARVALAEFRPHVVLMDIGLPDGDGISLTREVCDAAPGTKVIMVTMEKGEPYVRLAREAGAFAYVCKEDLDSALPRQLDRALAACGDEEGGRA